MFVHGPHQALERSCAPGAPGPIARSAGRHGPRRGVTSDDLIRRLASTCPLPLADRWAPPAFNDDTNARTRRGYRRAKALREDSRDGEKPPRRKEQPWCHTAHRSGLWRTIA